MAGERKTKMISARLPAALVERVDYVVRNPPTADVKNRSSAIEAALGQWLPGQEQQLVHLGVIPKKAR